MNRNFWLIVSTCAALIAPTVAARSRSNSQTQLPGPFLLADVDGDGRNDFVAYWKVGSPQLATGSTSYPIRQYARMDLNGILAWAYISIDKIWAGRFADPLKDSICFRAKTGSAWYPQNIYCFQQSTGTFGTLLLETGSGPAPVEWASEDEFLVGDFDGDGYDELLTYNPNGSAGANIHIFKYNRVSGKFEIGPFDLGNLKGFTWPGMLEFHAGRFASFSGEGTRDDLLIFNRSTRQVARFDARLYGSTNTFWWAFTSASVVQSAEEVRVADADGDGRDDLVLHGYYSGVNRFLSMSNFNLPALPADQPNSGQLPSFFSLENHIYFGLMKNFPGEGGSTNSRDDVLVYFPGSGGLSKYDARYWPPSRTYWWDYSVNRSYIPSALGIVQWMNL